MLTDTVYGLVCSVDFPDSVKKIYSLKGRENKPGTIIAANAEQLLKMGFSADQIDKASQFWPGPVSVILNAPDKLSYLHMGKKSLAVRIPKPEWLRDILDQTGPLATSSANLAGEPTVNTVEQAKKLFGDSVDLYVDGGDLSNSKPSKIVRVKEDGNVEIIRP